MKTRVNRRRFLGAAAWGGAGLCVLRNAASAWSYQANEKLNIALVGVGSRGKHFLGAIPRMGENLVALCDVDKRHTEGPAKDLPGARQFQDYRKMLDAMGAQIDALVVATPVHSHAVIATEAMRRGKHVYVEKPVAHEVSEARAMRDLARRQKVATQMGNQGMATDSFRRTLELIEQGAIGEVREAHVLFESGGTGPMKRPAEPSPVPECLDWDLWLGPAAARPFHPGYLNPDFPGAGGKGFDATLIGWNRWRDFGAGGLGGAGSHSLNLAFKALNAGMLWDGAERGTIRVTTEVSEACPDNFPCCQIVHFELPARGAQGPAQIHWYNAWDTEIKRRGILDRMEAIAGQSLAWARGSWSPHSFLLVVGSKGCAWANFHNSVCKLLPEKDFADSGGPPQTLPQSGSHEREWVAACKGGPKPMSNFDHSGPLVELLLLGNVAAMVEGPLEFDPQTLKIVNNAEADALVRPRYRPGWSL